MSQHTTSYIALGAFVSGVATTLLYQKAFKEKPVAKLYTQRETKQNKEILDSPELNHRILRKAEYVLQCRTSRIIVVVERCTNDHNYSAILRTCEALGIQNVYLICPRKPETNMIAKVKEDSFTNSASSEYQPDEIDTSDVNTTSQKNSKRERPQLISSTGSNVKDVNSDDLTSRKMHHLFAQRAAQWLTIREFETSELCIQALRQEKRTIWVTDLSQEAVCMTREALSTAHDIDQINIVPEKLAIVFGTEAVGCTQIMLEAADLRVYLPMYGFADSLNLSVSTALCLQQIFHLCPEAIGDMPEQDRSKLREQWFVKLASQRITTTGERKNRTRLMTQIEKAKELERKAIQKGIEALEPEQIMKLEKLPQLLEQFDTLEKQVKTRAKLAVRPLLDHPPEPISDVRRADVHRIPYLGTSTKKKYKDIWKEMAAFKNGGNTNPKSTALEFRELLKDAQGNTGQI